MNDATVAQFQKEELESEFSEGDKEYLRKDLNKLGLRDWLDWAYDNHFEATEYLRAPPKLRAQKKKWQDKALRRRLSLLSILQADIAKSMLAAADKLAYRGDKKHLVSLAATLGIDVVIESSLRRWPFHTDPPRNWDTRKKEFVRFEFRSTKTTSQIP